MLDANLYLGTYRAANVRLRVAIHTCEHAHKQAFARDTYFGVVPLGVCVRMHHAVKDMHWTQHTCYAIGFLRMKCA